MWLFSHSIQEVVKAALSHLMTADNKKNQEQEGKLTKYCEVVNYLLEMCGTDDVIDKAEADIKSHKQPTEWTAGRYYETLCKRALRCGMVYNEWRFKEFFIEGISSSICYSCVPTIERRRKLLYKAWRVMRQPCSNYEKAFIVLLHRCQKTLEVD